jgi:hypothetical protein
MVAAMDESEAAGAKRDATIKSRRRWRRVATIVIGIQRRRWTIAFEGVGDVRWHSMETAMVRRGGSKMTARIESKRRMADTADVRIELKRRIADGGCQTAVSAVVNIGWREDQTTMSRSHP